MQVNIPAAVRIYYEKLSLSNKDIMAIFDIKSGCSALKKKRQVIEYFADKDENPIHSINNRLDTYRAFEAWGLNIEDLERRYKKLQKYGFGTEG